MFDRKKTKLFSQNKKKTSVFISAAQKETTVTRSENGAKKYTTTGNPFVDQFSVLGSYKAPRAFKDIAADCEILWAHSPIMCVMFMFYIRTICRVVNLFTGISTKAVQKGAELKHEGIMRAIWLQMKQPPSFWKNVTLWVSIGSWKDVFTMLNYDLVYHGWNDRKLDWDKFGELILSGLENEYTSELVKKYLPTIKSDNRCNTVESQANNLIGKWICSLLYGNKSEQSGYTYKKYRKLKSSGTAHEWQQLISRQQFGRIDFSKIHGRALSLLVKGKFLFNQNLSDKYEAWITKPETKDVKYTGFVHELFAQFPTQFEGYNAKGVGKSLVSVAKHIQETINKQFYTLVKKGGESKTTRLVVARDVSGSMRAQATGTSTSCFDVTKSLALYFSEFLNGAFANSYIEFSNTAIMRTWKGNTPIEKWFNDDRAKVGGTDFQSVIDLFVQLKRQGLSEDEFPEGILCISDTEFNPSDAFDRTNVERAYSKLRNAGFSDNYVNNFRIVLWNLQSYGRGNKFETQAGVKNCFYFSGYSPQVISFLTGEIETSEQAFDNAMNQEVLNMIQL